MKINNPKRSTKTGYAIVAGAGLAAGAFLMHVIERVAYKSDLEFLGMATQYAEEAVDTAKRVVEGDEDGDSRD
ncbi:hypothetical protein FDH65_gp34 [Arthrobacter phage Circum]|uniref:Uncharacterized protein n=1 Tax=Arthrobacter phage Circum TaxID=1772295 RepID=A0A0U4IKJ0_9CAUD|nr:hypothetical protein FDH65_gp34 [Arthrobacter phage Circum]ALY08719.1 hypothetical protein CIRCUM_34 [Arthrobacter phage Circum]